MRNCLYPPSYPRCTVIRELSILIFTDGEMKSYEATVSHNLIFIQAAHSIINLSEDRSICRYTILCIGELMNRLKHGLVFTKSRVLPLCPTIALRFYTLLHSGVVQLDYVLR